MGDTLSVTLGKLGTAVRGVLGTTDKMKLSVMANNLVAAQSAIRSAYDKIASMGGAIPDKPLVFGLTNAIGTIPTGGTSVQTASGILTLDAAGHADVNLGFKPDVVFIQGNAEDIGDSRVMYSQAMAFDLERRLETTTRTPYTIMLAQSGGAVHVRWARSSAGFSIDAALFDVNYNMLPSDGESFEYAAATYTDA